MWKIICKGLNLKRHQLTHAKSADTFYTCKICQTTFTRLENFTCYKKYHSAENSCFKCNVCNKVFTRADSLKRHLSSHQNPQYPCQECEEKFSGKEHLIHHTLVSYSSPSTYVPVKKPRLNPQVSKNNIKRIDALDVFSSIYFESNLETANDITTFFQQQKKRFIWLIGWSS